MSAMGNTHRENCDGKHISQHFLQENLYRLYRHNRILKFIIGDKRFGFNTGFVIIDSINGVFQDVGYLFRIANTQPYQGTNPQVGVEQLIGQKLHAVFFGK